MATINSTLRSTAARVPDREALVFGDIRYSYAEFDTLVDRVAGIFQDSGISKGDRLAIMASNSDRFVVTYYAAQRLGCIVVPVNPGSAAPELTHLLHDSGATVLVFDQIVERVVDEVVATATSALTLFALQPIAGYADLFELAAEAPFRRVDVKLSESDDAQLLYTSGTTGAPKGALFDNHRALWTAMSCIGTMGMADEDRLLHVAPLYHAAELGIMLISGVLIGATHIVHKGFDPLKVVETLEQERITMFFGVPTMYQFILRTPKLADRDLSALRTGMFGAAPMPASSVKQLVKALPSVKLFQLCGQTEGGPGGIYSNDAQVRERPETSGRQAIVMSECRVVDEFDRNVSAGSVGELILRGESVMKGYWNNPKATAETIRNGWLYTGDLMRLDADGYMTLLDRKKDMIITGGRNVYSIEVENAIAAHPAIQDSAIVGEFDEEYGESIVAVVVLKPAQSLELDDLRTFCCDRVSRYKAPHRLVVVENIPRNASGKVLKRVIKEQLLLGP